jgi:hypothetical protein
MGDSSARHCCVFSADEPLPYAGEWGQILYKKFGILSVDVDLPNTGYNEGYRGIDYDHSKVKNDDFNNGVLVKGSFYRLLEKYTEEINK